jgi:F-type H+-transporting ATPase subunit gamma
MLSKKLVASQINELNVLEMVTQAYAEIASMRMKKIRAFVLKNREFMGSIEDIFQEVLNSYRHRILSLAKERRLGKDKNITFLSHNGKKAAVFLSANTGLYGDIVSKTFELFIKEIEKENLEVTIIGKLGKALFEQVKPNTPYTYFDFPDYQTNEEQFVQIIKHLVAYEEIRVFYGKFQSAVAQVAAESSISAVTSSLEKKEEIEKPVIKYLFEPSLEEILMFFEAEIFASLLDQIIRESQLAKLGSRITAMSKATENINKSLNEIKLAKLKLSHNLANRKQLNSLSGLLLRKEGIYG